MLFALGCEERVELRCTRGRDLAGHSGRLGERLAKRVEHAEEDLRLISRCPGRAYLGDT